MGMAARVFVWLVSGLAMFLASGCSPRAPFKNLPAAGEAESTPGPGPATDAVNRAIRENKVKVILISFYNESMKDASGPKRDFDGFMKESFGPLYREGHLRRSGGLARPGTRQAAGLDPGMSSPVTLALTPPQGKIVGSYQGYPSPQSIRNLLSACSLRGAAQAAGR